ncbi:hypothetical protein MSG28_005839 [Choristoneura fumiferana]|uniref:Uncharacterized protein n=1 Tax=Choristoneura fumiferana TaxID=7141 RepID=A0ACC0L0F8_CHOFU|nr:hypothetical protein MSG28_005839 [Choristoneura fumiferana]
MPSCLKNILLRVSCLLFCTPVLSQYGSFFDAVSGFLRDTRNMYVGEPPDAEVLRSEYDFVIIGAGTAGCVLSNRLTEVKQFKVLLIEAGGSEQMFMDIPVMATMLQFTDANWDYHTEPQKAGCMGMRDGRCAWPRGRVVGGSSVLHSMMHTRGNRRDYDRWAANGNPGWEFASVLHYFKKSENMQIPELRRNKLYHNTEGEMFLQYPNWRTPLSDAFLQAGIETGGKIVDYNGEKQIGYSIIQFTMKNGTRMSTSRAFLHPIKYRKNFQVAKNAMVTRILINPSTKQAYGVEFRKGNKKYVVKATREVILSAGAINSPQILMISGIGPKDHLTEKNITTIMDLPVGYNLQDHWALGGLTFLINTTDSIRMERVATISNIIEYFSTHNGPISAPSGTEAIAFIDTKNPNNDDGYPDLELLFVGGSLVSQPSYKQAFAIDDQIYDEVYGPIQDRDTWMVFPMLLLPESKGRIMLRTKNPYKKPLIYANYFSDNGHDQKVILHGIRKVIELSKTKAFQKYGSRLHDIPLPNCAHHKFNTDAYWYCAMKTITNTIYHHCCTTKMGPKDDSEAVVDSRLRVYGVRGLRVVDASIMPNVPAAHTNAPTMMIAEKAADMIKEDWGINTQLLNPITSLANFLNEGGHQYDNEPPDQTELLSEYDFIIVGAGTAGCVLANRLTEVKEWKVLLVEAGVNENFIMDIPLVANYLQFSSANWKYKTKASSKYCAGFENQQCNWPRGKVVGGSSVLNYMIYTRGAPQDYDNWKAMGNEGWGWDDVLPYFKKIENFNIPSFDDPKYHARGGHVNVEHAPFRTTKGKAWVKGAQEYGFKYGDYNGATPAAVSFLQLSMKNGTRHSSSRAYLHPINGRKNLHLSKASLVTKLIMDDSKTKVIGIELEKHNIRYKIRAEKEVILSAGALNTPQLLMLSGIGPRSHLESVKIPVIKDLPVGYNLMDHIAAGGVQYVVRPQNVTLSTEYIFNHIELIFKWMRTHKGPLSIPGGCEALIFMELQDKFNLTGWPDMELLFITGGLNSDPMLRRNFGFDDQIFADTYGSLGKTETFMVFPMLMRPKSKGRVMLRSRNPKAHPMLIPNYFEDPEDLQKIVEGLKSPLSEYDYIIVGAGSAGCTLAARLTEDPKTTVLLLEAGKGEMFTTDAPAIAAFFQRTDYTWQYFMEKEPGVCLGHMMKFLNTTRNLSDGGPGGSKAVRRGMMISEKIFDAAYGSIDDTDTWSPFLMLLHPESFGFIELKDNNPWSHPRMHGRYLSDAGGKDVATFVAAVRFVQELVATTPFQRFGARLHRAQYPACRALPFDSDAYWECAVRTLTATLHHQIATCRMGPAGDPQAVVDPRLRVHGLRNLRVVDSSIIPRTVAAHTNAPAIMIGEKAADMIKEDANR